MLSSTGDHPWTTRLEPVNIVCFWFWDLQHSQKSRSFQAKQISIGFPGSISLPRAHSTAVLKAVSLRAADFWCVCRFGNFGPPRWVTSLAKHSPKRWCLSEQGAPKGGMQRWKAETNTKPFRKIFTHAFSGTKTMIFSDQVYHKNHALRKKIKYNILARVLLYTPVTYHKKLVQ